MDNLSNNISQISNKHYHYLMSLENVNGVGLSYKYINGKNTFEPCLCVLVQNKVDSKFLTSNNIIPKTYMGIKTDVLAVGKPSIESTPLSEITLKLRPLEAGGRIAPLNSKFYGTICCIVKKTRFNFKLFKKVTKYYILSTNHLLANANKTPLGNFILQPGYFQNTKISSDIIATLYDFVSIKFKERNEVDAAIAKIIDSSEISNLVYSEGEIKGSFKNITLDNLLMPVKKVGCATGVTFGKIRLINTTAIVNFQSSGDVMFKNQIVSELKTAPGDSGSPILTYDNKIVGMHISSINSFSYANDINTILKKLKVELYLG